MKNSEQQEPIVNRVAQSTLITLDLEKMFDTGPRTVLDIKDQLFQGMILKEKDFRDFLKKQDWSVYQGHNVAILCSVDAIVPTWAYMLLAIHLAPYVNHLVFGDLKELDRSLFQKALSNMDLEEYQDAKVVIKGCGKLPIPESAFVEVVRLLQGVAGSIMYGEPCSTVPLYKKPRQ
ncbi:MAG: hypothetical protein DHS20C17_11580 [Cyclobacteriaceae bacterium]|nr:MAG: hypothetical protein DHS20C17_11580 [Cyclobacteriaceae bacterium]